MKFPTLQNLINLISNYKNMRLPDFDENIEFEKFHYPDQYLHIIKINSIDPNKYLDEMNEWYKELAEYTDKNGKAIHKVIQIYLKLPPMSSILSFIEKPMPENFEWSPVAIIQPSDIKVVDLFMPVINWAANLNKNREKVMVAFFSSKHLVDQQPVFEWLDKVWNKRYPELSSKSE